MELEDVDVLFGVEELNSQMHNVGEKFLSQKLEDLVELEGMVVMVEDIIINQDLIRDQMDLQGKQETVLDLMEP